MENALGKVVKFSRSKEADFERYLRAVANDDIVTACVYFGDLKHNDLPKLFLIQSVLYSKTRRLVEECQCLVKMLTYENFSEFNISFVIDLLGMFFRETISRDVSEYYVELLKKRAEVSNQHVRPRIIKEKSKLRFVDESDGFFEIVEINDLIMTQRFDDALEKIKRIDKKSFAFEHAKIKQAYIYFLTGDNENFERLIENIYTKYPDKKRLLINLLSLYGGESLSIHNIREDVLDGLENNGSIFLKIDALIKKSEFNMAKKMLDTLSGLDRFLEKTITSYIECFFGMRDYENLKKFLRIFYLLSNGNVFIKRYVRIVERKNFAIDFEKDFFSSIYEKAKSELERESVEIISLTDVDFAKKEPDEIFDCLYFCASQNKTKYLTQILNKILRTRSDGFLMIRDMLIDIKIGDKMIYLILVALMNNVFRGEFFVILEGKLRKIKTKYPSILLDEFGFLDENINGLKIHFLRLAYAESFIYNIYNNNENENICKQGDDLFKRIQNLPQSKCEIFENKNIISAVLCSLDFLSDVERISMIAKDFSLSKVALVKVLRLLEYID